MLNVGVMAHYQYYIKKTQHSLEVPLISLQMGYNYVVKLQITFAKMQ